MNSEKLESTFETFEGLQGEEFSAQHGDQIIRFKLIEVSRLPPATTRTDLGIRQDPFALLFNEVTDFQPDQGTYTVKNEVGTAELFLVPVGFGDYEAVFN